MVKPLKKLRVGVIGCGRISVMHFDAVKLCGGVAELVACCDIKKDRADEAAALYGCAAYTDYRVMIEHENLDIVHLCLPHYLHVPVAEYAFSRGVHVLSEKPMSTDLESAERAVGLAAEAGGNYGVIFQCRYNDASQLVKKAVQSGKLGKILSVRSTLTWYRPDSYYSESDWKGTWDKEGGGVVIDQAIHSVDLVNWIVDSETVNVSVSMANRGHEAVVVEDSAEGLISYRNGVKYGFYCMNNYGCDEPIEIRLFCEKGKAVFGYDDAYITYSDGTTEEAHQRDEVVSTGGKDYWGSSHKRQIEQFYSACLNGEKPEIDGAEALRTHRLIMEIYEKGGMRGAKNS